MDVNGMTPEGAAAALNTAWQQHNEDAQRHGYTFRVSRPRGVSAKLCNQVADAMGLPSSPRWT